MSAPVVVLDAFCGAGGTVTGARRALRRRRLAHKVIAVNHDEIALETHALNHPDAVHVKANVYRADPRALVDGRKVDIFMASPTCTFFARARGGKPISRDQKYGRMTPTQVYRWAKALLPEMILVENVPEFQAWGPIDRKTEKPIKAKAGIYFRAWKRRLVRLGYKIEDRVLNAANFGALTTRERYFLIAVLDHSRVIRWPAPTHSKDGSGDLFGAGTKRWEPAWKAINWKLRGKSIFTRKKPLVEATLARIWTGAIRERWPQVLIDLLKLYAWALDFELPQVDRVEGRSRGDAVPFVFQMNQSRGRARGHKGFDETLGTITATGTDLGLVVPLRRHANGQSPGRPLPTITAGGEHIALAQAVLLAQGQGGVARSVGEPAPTLATRGAVSLVVPYHRTSRTRSVEEPLGTATTRDHFGIVMPVTHADGSNRSRSADEPLPTVTGANRGELAFVVAQFGEREGQTPRFHTLNKPLPTLCAKGRVQLVQAIVTELGVDILFRMLTPRELARAMGFPASYRWAGNKTQIVKQIGNAVDVHQAEALVEAMLETGGRRRRRRAA